MAIRYKVDILAALKRKGYSSSRIREEKLIGQSYLQQLRRGELVSWKTLDTICSLLECQPGDLIEYVEEHTESAAQDGCAIGGRCITGKSKLFYPKAVLCGSLSQQERFLFRNTVSATVSGCSNAAPFYGYKRQKRRAFHNSGTSRRFIISSP